MSFEVYKKAVSLNDSYICIGGGEPTIHPKFWDFIAYALEKKKSIWLATNGKKTKTAITLASMSTKKNIKLKAELSLDPWHEKINSSVVKVFKNINSIREGYSLVHSGRAKYFFKDTLAGCSCSLPFIKPSGTIKYCGCKNSKTIGSVDIGIPDYYKGLLKKYNCIKRFKNFLLLNYAY